MGMGFAPTWLRQASPPPPLHKTTLTTATKFQADSTCTLPNYAFAANDLMTLTFWPRKPVLYEVSRDEPLHQMRMLRSYFIQLWRLQFGCRLLSHFGPSDGDHKRNFPEHSTCST